MLLVSLQVSLKSVLQTQWLLISKQEDNYNVKFDTNYQLNYINIYKWLQNAIKNKYFATTDGIVH